MTLYQFTALDDDGQKRVLWDGKYLTVRVEDNNMVQLYSLGDFYIEVYYSPSSNEIMNVRPFRSIELLEPYLDFLDLDEL